MESTSKYVFGNGVIKQVNHKVGDPRFTVELLPYRTKMGITAGAGYGPRLKMYAVVQATRIGRAPNIKSKYEQGSYRKWTPEVEKELREKAEKHAKFLNSSHTFGGPLTAKEVAVLNRPIDPLFGT